MSDPSHTDPTAGPADPAAQRALLDNHWQQAQAIILSRQDARTGLLPASTAITVHGDYTHAWVRDNVYSILAVWGLGLAYRHVDAARAADLQRCVVRLMRGLLAAMTKQAHKVERFKQTQHPLDALHAKYDTARGEPVVGDADWGHLQIDATAIFVLQLAQMSASGLRIVQTPAEVSFVQNLVHYLAAAHRTPDYGIWERGHKRNEGTAELNASSVGMAKAALEAVSGFDFLPGAAPVIHVMADDIANARSTLTALLPRESLSKETDAALLSVIGYPAFAVEDAALEARTRREVTEKLHGPYGCKRFLRDGHQTVVEDHSRMYYEPGELARFEHIESEWPLFFTYFLLDAVLRGDTAAAADYRTRLDALRCERASEQGPQWLLPELYLVPADAVEAERARPHSQPRVPNENVPLVWAQSLYMLGALVQEGHLAARDIDPLGRRLRAAAAPPATVQVALLADSELARSRLAAQGVTAETLQAVLPLQVRDARELQTACAKLGAEPELGLTGRPAHRVGSLATAQVYLHGSQQVVYLPPFLDRTGFYLSLDNRLLVAQIDTEIAFMRRHWRQRGAPLLALLVTDAMLDAAGADGLVARLAAFASGSVAGVHVGPLAELAAQAAPHRIDWLTHLPMSAAAVQADAAARPTLAWEEAATRPLTAARAAALEREPDDAVLQRQLGRSRNPYEQIELLALLQRRRGDDADTGQGSVRQLAEAVYARACRQRQWAVMRRAVGVLGIHDATLEDAVAQMVVRGKRVAVGRAYSSGSVLAVPLPNAEIVARIQAHGGGDARGRVLIEEIVLLLGMLVKAEPTLFAGTLTLRAWHLLLLVTGWLAREHGVTQGEAMDHLLDLSPQAILQRLREVIAHEQEMAQNLVRMQAMHQSGPSDGLAQLSFPPSNDPSPAPDEASGGWLAWREMSGAITRLPDDFYARVWELLRHCSGLVIGDQLDSRNCLVSALTRADMTAAEHGFALQVEDLLNKIQAPEYRQLSIEALLALSDIARANADLLIDGPMVLDVLVGHAVRLTWLQTHPGPVVDYNEHRAGAWAAFYASPPHRVANGVMASLALLLAPAEAESASDTKG